MFLLRDREFSGALPFELIWGTTDRLKTRSARPSGCMMSPDERFTPFQV